ncbi:hypothetical protein IE077_002282 [Cardiosporidium cionae]|uniref:Uncharacterized protein n=1 Tax=Cardiosporidium cionae TaxID=476202 RepID=A0ABQ7JG57_9APIC|nr:hypothetical protein IE077_002282 [Cardiosporidium cionae]|eukprot:KAF8822869.1 hypothetical protein IE077_002282 [Cardiosporidium cionae]
MVLKDCFCLAYAPLQGTGLDGPQEYDANFENLNCEVQFLHKFLTNSFEVFIGALEDSSCDDKTEEIAVTLHCLQRFLERTHALAGSASRLADRTLQDEYPDFHNYLNDLKGAAQSSGIETSHKDLDKFVVTDADAEWQFKTNNKSRVAFRRAVSVVETQEEGEMDMAKKIHKDIKSEIQERRLARHQTGYNAFTYKETLEKEIEDYEKEWQETVDSKTSSLTSGRQVQDSSCFNLMGILCCNDNNSWNTEDNTEIPLMRRQSSVSLGSVQEIQDQCSDNNWSEAERHQQRFKRIRNRKPTGHSSLMKTNSQELIKELEAAENDETDKMQAQFQEAKTVGSIPPVLFGNKPAEGPSTKIAHKSIPLKKIHVTDVEERMAEL